MPLLARADRAAHFSALLPDLERVTKALVELPNYHGLSRSKVLTPLKTF